MKDLPWTWFDYRTDLPRWLAASVGQIAVEWSVLERELHELLQLLMDIDLRKGRIATMGMNVRTQLAIAKNFIQEKVYHKDLDPKFFDEISTFASSITEKLESERNMIVHGLWARREGRWYVLRLTGSRKTPELKPKIEKLFRSVLPKKEEITPEKAEAIAQKIAKASADVVDLCDRLAGALAPLTYKRPEYTRRHRPPRIHKKKALSSPRRSSPE
jgi:hypothetical protein